MKMHRTKSARKAAAVTSLHSHRSRGPADVRGPNDAYVEPQCSDCPMRRFAFYGDDDVIAPEHLQQCRRAVRSFRRGEIIWREGEPVDGFAQLRDGWALRYKVLPDGGRQVLSVAITGDALSFAVLWSDTHRFFVQAVTDVTVCFFSSDAMRALSEVRQANKRLLYLLVEGKQAMADRVVDLGRRDAGQRLARFFLEMEGRLDARGLRGGNFIEMPLTQDMLADIVGITNVHVSRVMREFRDEGVLVHSGQRLQIISREKLKFRAGQHATLPSN